MKNQQEYIIRAEKIIKEFSGVRVLHAVDFSLLRGEIHAVIGERSWKINFDEYNFRSVQTDGRQNICQ
jgi:hypothetical protein